jgi:hypothetical protein
MRSGRDTRKIEFHHWPQLSARPEQSLPLIHPKSTMVLALSVIYQLNKVLMSE